MKQFKTTHFRNLAMFVLIAGLTFTSCKDSSTSAYDEKDMAISAQSMGDMMNTTTTNVYISDTNTDTYDPLFPSTADPNWETTVCYKENSFGINATWSNPHKAFDVGPHPWDNGTFAARWINSANSIDSNQTVDKDGNKGPGGFNWTRYDKQVAGNGDFVVQLLADNCSWIYLTDENGNSPELVGYQGAVSTPGEYLVNLDGDHTLIFIIFDGGGLAGGKFRLETTESFGGDTPDPIEPNEPESNVYTSKAGIQTYEPILVPRRFDHATSQCTNDGSIGQYVVGFNDPRWIPVDHGAYSVRDQLPSHWNSEFTFERAWGGIHGLANFDAEWINAKNTWRSDATVPTDYTGPLPYSGANWTRYDLPVEGNGNFELKLLADDCSWIYLSDEDGSNPRVIGYQDNPGPNGPEKVNYGVSLDGRHLLTFIIFDQGGEAGGKFILETTTDVVDPYVPPTPVNNAPVANAGADQTLDATGTTTPVTLDGSGSSDPDGDNLSYSWVLNGDEVATSASANVNLAKGSYTLTLTVSDGELSDSDEVNVTVRNTVPVADAGDDISKDATGQTTPVNLDGSASTDADGDALNYSWTLDGDEVANTETATISLPDGDYVITLIVSDAEGASSSDEVNVSVKNTTPVANAGDDVTTEATGLTTPITLTGSGTDADGDELTFSWSNGATSASTTVELGVGVHTFILTVADGQGASDTDEVVITITDTNAPTLSFKQETANLWPPNHKMVLVVTGISASDTVDGTTPVTVTVSSSEAANGKGDGNTNSDYEVVTKSDGSQDVYVRSERSGKGNNGRTYTITMSTSDEVGNTSTESVEVTVAQNKGRGK